MTGTVSIRLAGPADAAALNAALRRLSAALGDTHRASDADILAAGFGPRPSFHALMAESPGAEGGALGGAVVGAAVFSPLYSTVRGHAGAYVSDLWVDDGQRGSGLGARLLAAVRDEAAARWGAGFLRLAVSDANARARAFYHRLGFAPAADETWLTLTGAALAALKEA